MFCQEENVGMAKKGISAPVWFNSSCWTKALKEMGLLQNRVVVPVMHFAPSGIRKRRTHLVNIQLSSRKQKVAEAERRGWNWLSFLSLLLL